MQKCKSPLDNFHMASTLSQTYSMYRHPERAFFQKSQTFGLGQENWAKKCRGILGIFGRYIFWHCESLLRGFDCLFGAVSFLKTLDFRPKIYESQINPKIDIGHKEFGRYSHHRSVVGHRQVSSTPFGILFCLPVQFQNSGSSLFIICK